MYGKNPTQPISKLNLTEAHHSRTKSPTKNIFTVFETWYGELA